MPRIAEKVVDSPWLILSPFLLVTPLVLSGVVRCVLGLSLSAALVVAIVGMALFVVALRPLRSSLRISGWTRMATLSWLFAFSTLLIWLLYRPAYGGLISGPFGVDTGNHAAFFREFIDSDPSTYHGFVGLYALMYWLRPIAGGTFEALRACFYLAVLAIPCCLALSMAAATSDLGQRRCARWLVLAGIGALGFCLFTVIVYPILHYNQSDGFYSHLFGIYPFFLCWISYGLIDDPRRRAVVLMAWVALLRYVYALNLGELLVTGAVLMASDLGRDPVRLVRRAGWAACLASAALALFFFRALYSWAPRDGFFPPYEFAWVLPALLVSGVAMLVAPRLLQRAEIQLSPPVLRWARFASIFVIVNNLAAIAFWLAGNPTNYYFQKYLLFPVLITCTVLLVLLAQIATAVTLRGWAPWLRSRAGRRAAGAIVATMALLTFAFNRGFRAYHAGAYERATGKPLAGAPPSLEALFDADADGIISGVLKQSGKRFGGYLQPFFPRAYFMNVIRGQLTFGDYFTRWDAFHDRSVLFPERPGYCYFFEQPLAVYRDQKLAMAAQVEQLSSRADKVCARYRRRWRPAEVVELCSLCL